MSWNKLSDHERAELNKTLTNRQFAVYALWLAGCTYRSISEMLGISQRTVRTHLDRARMIHTNIIEGEQ